MPSWRDFHEVCHDGQYFLFDGSARRASAIATSPIPFFKPGVESILQEFDKPPGKRNPSVIAAGAAMLDPQIVSTLPSLADDSARLELLAAYDPRFGRLSDDMAQELLGHLGAIAGRESPALRPRKGPGGQRSRKGKKLAAYFDLHPEEARAVCAAHGRQGAGIIREIIKSAGVRIYGDGRDKPAIAICRRAAAAAVKKSRV